MKRILIYTTLKSQVNFEETSDKKQIEPIHPYMGILWTKIIESTGNKVDYLNTIDYTSDIKKNSLLSIISLPKKYSTLIIHSTSGLGKASLIRLFNWKLNIVFYSLSKINPSGNLLQIYLRKFLSYTDLLSSNHIVYGMSDLFPNIYKINNNATYFPFFTDFNYFQSLLNDSTEIRNDKFILVVGDITRDDEYVYGELSDVSIPIIRITRDPKVINVVDKLINKSRGDLVLSGVSFLELANLYNRANCCIVASKFDNWQPGGITSIAEALACNGICICNGGGEIESEFNFLSESNNIENPLLFFDYPLKNGLKNLVLKHLQTTNNQIIEMKNKSKFFSSKALNFNNEGSKIMHKIILNYFK